MFSICVTVVTSNCVQALRQLALRNYTNSPSQVSHAKLQVYLQFRRNCFFCRAPKQHISSGCFFRYPQNAIKFDQLLRKQNISTVSQSFTVSLKHFFSILLCHCWLKFQEFFHFKLFLQQSTICCLSRLTFSRKQLKNYHLSLIPVIKFTIMRRCCFILVSIQSPRCNQSSKNF